MLSTDDILRRLKELREEKQLNQEYIAGALGIDRTTYIRKEKGNIPITTDEWIRLARALEKEVTHFFNVNGSENHESEADKQERTVITLLRSLSIEEREDLLSGIRLLLKGIKRKKVVKTLDMLF